METWLPIAGFEGLYEVSSDGQIRTHRRQGTNSRVLVGREHNGYRRVDLYKRRKRHPRYIHALVLEAFSGARPIGYEACHSNGVRSDNRVENLRWGSRSENCEDSRIHGTLARGSRNGRSRLSEDQVKHIYADSRPSKIVAADYRITAGTVRDIKRGASWAWLTKS